MDSEALNKRLHEHSVFFDALIEMIPAKFYLTSQSAMQEQFAGKQPSQDSRFMHNKKANKKRKLELKVEAEEALKLKKKQMKLQKLDPSAHKSTVQLQREHVMAQLPVEPSVPQAPAPVEESQPQNPNGRAATIAELKERLTRKIAQFQARRQSVHPARDPAAHASKSREKILEQRRSDKIQAANRQKQIKEQSLIGKHDNPAQEQKPAKHDGISIQMNKIEFETVKTPGEPADKKKKSSLKDPKLALAKLQKQQQNLASLKERDYERAEQVEADMKWQKSMKQAEGEKIKDNEKLLKKSIKKQEKLKQKSTVKWNERKQLEKDDKDRRQKKRNANLQKRIDDKKASKIKKRK